MDFTNHPLNKQSIVDNRQNINTNKSIIDIDELVNKLRLELGDSTIGSALVAKAFKYLGEAQVRNIADYANRKATQSAGRAFVKICSNELNKKGQ